MQANAVYIDRAFKSLKGHWIMSIQICIVFYLISALAAIDVCLAILLLPPLYGLDVIFFRLVRGEDTSVGNLFDGYIDLGRFLTTIMKVEVYIWLWSLLLVIPGIVKRYSYALVSYIFVDYPDLKDYEVIELSRRLMHGHKWKLLILDFNCILRFLPEMLILGIGFLRFIPHWKTARAHFYEDVLRECTDVEAR